MGSIVFKRKYVVISFLLVSCAIALAGWSVWRHSRNKLSLQAMSVLQSGDRLELLSLTPHEWTEDKLSTVEYFHKYPVLGKIEIKDSTKREALLIELQTAMENYGEQSKCFNPRHGIRAARGDEIVELVICFECGTIYFFSESNLTGC